MSTIDALVVHAIADGAKGTDAVLAWAKDDGVSLKPSDVAEAVARCKARALLGGVDGGWTLIDPSLRTRHRSVGPLAFRAMCEQAVG